MPEAVVHSPGTLSDALSTLARAGDSCRVLAGGTDILVLLNLGVLSAPVFVNIWGLEELRGIDDVGDSIRIGALTTYTRLIRSPLIMRFAPALVKASRTVGAIQIQNRGTIGGNIVNASPAGDTLPVLAAYGANLVIASERGERTVAFDDFYTGYRTTLLERDELLVAVVIPKLRDDEIDCFWKVGTRQAQAISKTVMAAKAMVNKEKIDAIRIGFGSVAPTVIRAPRTERLLESSPLSRALIKKAAETVVGEISPITDIRSTEHYRRTVTANILSRFLEGLGRDKLTD